MLLASGYLQDELALDAVEDRAAREWRLSLSGLAQTNPRFLDGSWQHHSDNQC
jgi:hypothetical protein